MFYVRECVFSVRGVCGDVLGSDLRRWFFMSHKNDVDLGLELLCMYQKIGQTLTLQDIADVCGVTYMCISKIEKRALKKIGGLIHRSKWI